MIETFVAVQPSQNFEVDTLRRPIDVPDSREVDELEVAGGVGAPGP